MPHTILKNGPSSNLLYKTISENTRSTINLIQRRYFSSESGLRTLKHLSIADSLQTIDLQLHNKYYVLSAVGALIKYAEYVQNIVFEPSSLKVEYIGVEHAMFIDSRTARHLELVENLVDPEGNKTLYSVLNYTKTYAGMRLLRANILQPLCDLATIEQRLNAVSELVAKENECIFADLSTILARWPNAGRVISLFVHKPLKETKKTMEHRINQIVQLLKLCETIPALAIVLARCSSPVFLACRALIDIEEFENLKKSLVEIVDQEQVNNKKQQAFVSILKPGVLEMLDVIRIAHSELVNDVNEYISTLSQKFSLPLRLSWHQMRGYYIMIPASACPGMYGASKSKKGRKELVSPDMSLTGTVSSTRRLPAEFIKVSRVRENVSCTTKYLTSLNNRISDFESQIQTLTNK